jgi:hypothetical protein
MRDHFPGVLAGALVLGSFLYGFLAFLVAGLRRRKGAR